LSVYAEQFRVDDTQEIIDEDIDFESGFPSEVFDIDLHQRSCGVHFVHLSFPASFLIMLTELDFQEFGKILKKIVFIDVAAGHDCDVQICICACKAADQRAEFG
jgi:hypothetical protein